VRDGEQPLILAQTAYGFRLPRGCRPFTNVALRNCRIQRKLFRKTSAASIALMSYIRHKTTDCEELKFG
jgi:hypothetical protein